MHHRLPAAVLFLLGCATLACAQANLIKNADFETRTPGSSLPGEGWWLYEARGQPDVRVDRAISHSGVASVRMHAKQDARFAVISPPFAVSAGDDLQYSGWVRCDAATPRASRSNFGLAFRDSEGRVFSRAYVTAELKPGEWTQLKGSTVAPAGAIRAEMHLGYTAAPGTLWYDDVSAAITNPLSLALVTPAQPWTGPQPVTVRVINRQDTGFKGAVRADIARRPGAPVPVELAAGAEKRVDVPITLSGVGQFDYAISLLDGETAVRTTKGKFRASPPLALAPACPCYHMAGQGDGTTRIDARIMVNPAARQGLRFVVTLVDAAGRQVGAASTAVSGEMAGVTLRVPIASPARFQANVRLVDATDRELAQATTDIHVRAADGPPIALGSDGFLRVDGKPHFPIGLYSSGRYEEMSGAGFSATHSYSVVTGEATEAPNPTDTQLKELLDRTWANGMRMVVEVPRKAVEKAQWAQIRRRIETFRNHPGLLCWSSEERVARGEAPLANVAALYRLVHELDPGHPLVLGDTRTVIGKLQKDRRDFFPDDAMDIGVWWWYPIPLHTPDGNGLDADPLTAGLLQPPSWLTTTLSRKPLWIAIQSYQRPQRDARFPNPAEYRCMAYLSIINGVKGLWFYTGSGQRDWQGKASGILNKPGEGNWAYVQKLVRELRDLEPVITAPAADEKLVLSPADVPVEFALRKYESALYLLAANKSDRAQTVRFTGSRIAGRRVTVVGEDRRATIEADALRDEFGPLGVHVYEIR